MEDKEGGRTIELAFSSELPIRSYNWDIGSYNEILDHKSESVDLKRLNGGAPLLLEHDRGEQIGVIENARIDADKVGRATVRFGRGSKASEIFQDVKDGIRSLVSVGYRIHELVTEKIDEVGGNTMRAIRWEPMEVSIVSIPADTSVGVGRSEKTDTNQLTIFEEKEDMKINRDATASGGGSGAPAPADPPKADVKAQVIERISKEDRKAMYEIAKRHGKLELYEKAIDADQDINEFRAALLNSFEGGENKTAGNIYRLPEGDRGESAGELFSRSEFYRNAIQTGNKAMKRGISIEIPRLGLGQQLNMSQRATLLTTTGVTGFERPPGIVELGQQPLTIAQLFAQGQTSQPTVRVTQEVSFTNAATAVAEEGQKPEASFDLVETDFGVKKIAVIGRVSDEMFSDFPMVRDYVNGRLTYMVQAKEDSELLNGTGSNSYTGILQTVGIQTQTAAAQLVHDAFFKAITKVRSVGFFEPDAIVVNHTDWQNLKLTKDGNGQYYAGGPFAGPYGVGGFTVAGFMWGLPVIATSSIAQGTGLVGAFRLGAQLFRRMGVTLDTTNSDASDFVYNRICIRVETRAALAVYRPLAFCSVTGIPLAI